MDYSAAGIEERGVIFYCGFLGSFFGSSWVMVGKKYPQPQCLC